MAGEDKNIQPGLQQPGNAGVVANPKAANDGDQIQELRKQLETIRAKCFHDDKPNPWINGTAIGFLSLGKSMEATRVSEKAAGPSTASVSNSDAAEPPRIFIFVDPAAPECEQDNIKKCVQEIPQTGVLRVSRFIGLQATKPASPGNSTGTYAPFRYNLPPVNAGTLGAHVSAPRNQEYLLSSNHVWAHNGRALKGTPITDPGAIDDVTAGPVVGTRSHFVSLQPAAWPFSWPSQGPVNFVDCALAETPQPRPANPPTELLPRIALLTPADLATLSQATAKKKGRATGETHSRIRIFDLATYIGFTFGTYYFEGLVGTFDNDRRIFAAPGDSGSVAFIDSLAPSKFSGQAIGLITARAYVFDDSDNFVAYIIAMCPMDAVMTELEKEMKLNPGDLKFFMS